MSSAALEVLGTLGGACIAVSLVPQTIKTYKTKSAGDISYVYQGIYIFGCTLVNIYAIGLQLWPVYVPCLIEETLIITLTVMKFMYTTKVIPSDSKLSTSNSGVPGKDGDVLTYKTNTHADETDDDSDDDENKAVEENGFKGVEKV